MCVCDRATRMFVVFHLLLMLIDGYMVRTCIVCVCVCVCVHACVRVHICMRACTSDQTLLCMCLDSQWAHFCFVNQTIQWNTNSQCWAQEEKENSQTVCTKYFLFVTPMVWNCSLYKSETHCITGHQAKSHDKAYLHINIGTISIALLISLICIYTSSKTKLLEQIETP